MQAVEKSNCFLPIPCRCLDASARLPGQQRIHLLLIQFNSVQSLSHVQLFVTPWTAAHQASLSNTNSQNPPKLMFIESVMPSNHLILCHPLLLLPSIFPSIRVFSNESALLIRWPKYWSFSFNISPANEHPVLISFKKMTLDSMVPLLENIHWYIIRRRKSLEWDSLKYPKTISRWSLIF